MNPKEHVVVSATILGGGGIRTHLALLLRLLRKRGIATTVFATGCCWEPSLLSELEAKGVKFVLPPKVLRALGRMGTLYSALTWPLRVPSAASSVYCIGPGRSHLLMHKLRPKGTLTINHEIAEPPGADSLAGLCARKLDVTVANSRRIAQLMSGYWPDKAIRIIPFLTSDQPMLPPTRSRVGETGSLRVSYLGRLVRHKRPDQLVRRWPWIMQQPGMSGARLDIYGGDSDGERMIDELRAFVGQAKLENIVRIHGAYQMSAVPQILSQTDMVVLPSLDEGLPLVLVEAMTHGVPFVATDSGGTEELGSDNPDVLVTRKKWEEFEAGLLQMAAKIQSGQINSRRVYQWSESRYGYEGVAQKWLDCLLHSQRFFAK